MSGPREELPRPTVARAVGSGVPDANDFLVWNGILIKTRPIPTWPAETLPERGRARRYRGRMISSSGRPDEPDSSGK